MKTKYIRFISFVLVIVLLFFCGFNNLYNVVPVNKSINPEAAKSSNEKQLRDTSNNIDNVYDEQTLEEVIAIIEDGTDINEFFHGSVLYGITIDTLYDAYYDGKTMEQLIDEYIDLYLKSAENQNTSNVNEAVTATGSDADTQTLPTDEEVSLWNSADVSTSIIKKISDISSVSMGNSLSALGCSSHGKLHKLTFISSEGEADAFCIDIGKSVHTGNIYSELSKKNELSVYGSIYYWYMNNKSNNAYAAASLVIWSYNFGAAIPESNTGTDYNNWYNTYFSAAINTLRNDNYLNADIIKKYISSICYAINNGPSCTITIWSSPISSNQRLITGNINEIPYNLTFHKIGVNKYGAVLDNGLSGAVYGIYKSSSCSSASLLYKYTTNSKGEFIFSGVEKYPELYIKEITAPKNYKLNTNVYKLVSSKTSMTAMDIEIECGRFCIKKTDSNTGNSVLDNASTYEASGRYILYNDKACTSPAKDIYGNYCIIYTSPTVQNMYWKDWCDDYGTNVGVYNTETGWFYSGYMAPGTYYLKETHAPEGYVINPEIITVKITATGKYAKDAVEISSSLTKDTPKEGTLSLYKNVDTGSEITYVSVEGAVYYLYAAEEIKDNSNNIIYNPNEYVDKFPETDENGYSELSDIIPGTYYIVEHEAPAGLYLADDIAKKHLEYAENGSIMSDITIENAKDYGVQVARVGDTSNTINVYDSPIYYGIKINKYTEDTGGNKSALEGAEFRLFDTSLIYAYDIQENLGLPTDNDGYCYEDFTLGEWEMLSKAQVRLNDNGYSLITDSMGKAESDICIPYGKYVLVEIHTPLNENNEEYLYRADPIVIDMADQASEDYILELDIYDAPTVYNLSLIKADYLTGEAIKENSCGFRIYSMDTNEYIYADGTDIFYTGEDGILNLTEIITSGTYMIEEAVAPEGYMSSDTNLIFHIYMEENQTYISVYDNATGNYQEPEIVQDTEVKYLFFSDNPYSIQINKVDENKSYVSGAELAIFLADENENYITDVNNNNIMLTIGGEEVHWYSENSSYVITNIPAGYYILSELTPPDNYLIASDIFFSVGIDNNDTENSTNYSLTGNGDIITMIDRSCGKITVYKTGDQLTEYEICQSPYGEYISFIYKNQGLKNVEYSIYDMDMQLVATMVTDETGYAVSCELPSGSYYLKETAAPEGYIIDNTLKMITINNISEGGYKNNQDSFNLNNEYQEVSIIFTKSEIDNTGNNKGLSNAVFGLYCKDSYIFDENTVLANSCLGYITTDNNGLGVYKGKLPSGSYYIKEVEAPKGYVLSNTCYDFHISLSNDDEAVIYNINNNQPIINYKKQGMLELYKSDRTTGEMLSGAEFTLYDMEDNVIATLLTDSNGYVSLNLDYGSYYLKETKAPEGYILDSTLHFLEINDEITTVTINMTNDSSIKLGIVERWFTTLGIAALLIILSLGFIVFIERKRKDKN